MNEFELQTNLDLTNEWNYGGDQFSQSNFSCIKNGRIHKEFWKESVNMMKPSPMIFLQQWAIDKKTSWELRIRRPWFIIRSPYSTIIIIMIIIIIISLYDSWAVIRGWAQLALLTWHPCGARAWNGRPPVPMHALCEKDSPRYII